MNVSDPNPAAKTRSGPPTWVWFVGGGCGLIVLLGVLVLVWAFYVGAQGPETDVYAGNEVPGRFLDAMREVGALESGERIDYFYSDALTDIRDGFYFVSDRRVVAFQGDAGDRALTAVVFDEIVDVQLDREESFFTDSQLTLELEDGSVVAFPVSSEHEGDVRFFETIRERIGTGAESTGQ